MDRFVDFDMEAGSTDRLETFKGKEPADCESLVRKIVALLQEEGVGILDLSKCVRVDSLALTLEVAASRLSFQVHFTEDYRPPDPPAAREKVATPMTQEKPAAGTTWRHSKTGNLYTILAVAIYCGKLEPVLAFYNNATGFPEGTELVVYVGHYDNPRGNGVYARPLSEWQEIVELPVTKYGCATIETRKVPRFTPVVS